MQIEVMFIKRVCADSYTVCHSFSTYSIYLLSNICVKRLRDSCVEESMFTLNNIF